MNALSLCSGIEGIGFGLRRVIPGYRTVCYVEADPFCQDILIRRMQDGWLDCAPIWPDLRTLTGEIVDWLVNPWHHPCEEGDMGAPRKDYDEATQLYNAGLSIGDVAKFYCITRQAMWKILKRRAVVFRPQEREGQDNHFFRGGLTGKARANDLLERALQKGLITRSALCEMCGKLPAPYRDGRSGIQAHHDDYNKPLDVRWLCLPCHHAWHKRNRPIAYKEPPEEAGRGIDLIHAGFP